MSTETTDIPTLTTVADARTLLDQLAETHEWVSVFWDRGWGDSDQKAEISIIVEGDGQNPKAWITFDVYAQLTYGKVIGENTYMGYKKRRLHDYKSPPEPPLTVNPADVAEIVIRDLMAAHPDRPILAEFYRGLGRVCESAETLAVEDAMDIDGRHVLMLPGAYEVALSAQEPDPLGYRIIGGGLATCLPYPKTADGEVDAEALRGGEFAARLLAAVDEKVAVIEAARAKEN